MVVSIELDFKQIVDDISKETGINSELGAILNYRKSLVYQTLR